MAHLLNETVTVANFIGYTGAGVRTFAAAVSTRARIEWVDKELKIDTKQAVRIVAKIFLRPGVAVNVNDRITYDSKNYRVVMIEKPRDVTARVDHVMAMVSEEI